MGLVFVWEGQNLAIMLPPLVDHSENVPLNLVIYIRLPAFTGERALSLADASNMNLPLTPAYKATHDNFINKD